jgi:hypothetical protein
MVFFLGRFLSISAEIYEFFAVAVIAHMPPAILSIDKLVST